VLGARGGIIAFILTLTLYALRIVLDITTLGITISYYKDLGSLTTLAFQLG